MSTTTLERPEEAAFLQKRLALLGLVGASFSLFALASVVARILADGILAAAILPLAIHVLGTLPAAIAWLVCRNPARHVAPTHLAYIDAGTVVGTCVAFQMMVLSYPTFMRPELGGTLITMQVVLTRAVLVPSTARRTAVLSSASTLGVLVIAVLAQRRYAVTAGFTELTLPAVFVSVVIFLGTTVALATLTSSVIYGLRRAVRKAMELGQYTLLEKLGEGGMGQVFRARHAMLRRPTAVKLLHTASPSDLERFEHEVQLTAQLSHPNTVTVFDYGRTPDGVFYYAMELLDGSDLQNLVDRHGPMPAARVIHILAQVASGLAEAHAVSLIHRDIKPANIMLCRRGTTSDIAKVVDFGLVKKTEDKPAPGAEKELVVGTPLYLAPEMLKNPSAVDARTDLYSLGAVGYFLLTGTPVFQEESLIPLLHAHLHKQPEPMSERIATGVARDLERVLLDCLAKSQADRPADAATLRASLLACADAGGWTDDQARDWWNTAKVATVVDAEAVWDAKTIAVDVVQR